MDGVVVWVLVVTLKYGDANYNLPKAASMIVIDDIASAQS